MAGSAGATGAFVGTPAEVALVRMTTDGRLPVGKDISSKPRKQVVSIVFLRDVREKRGLANISPLFLLILRATEELQERVRCVHQDRQGGRAVDPLARNRGHDGQGHCRQRVAVGDLQPSEANDSVAKYV